MSEEIKIAQPKLHSSVKVQTLENTLLQSIKNFQDLVTELEEIYTTSELYKSQVLTLKDKCESQSCLSAESLKKVIASKEETIQSLANIFKELIETKDFNIINDAFQIIYGADHLKFTFKTETTSQEETSPVSENYNKEEANDSLPLSEVYDYPQTEILEISSGRKSPIFQTKKSRNASFSTIETTQIHEKKKCPSSWPTPESKTVKLSFPTPAKGKSNSKFRQARLSFVKAKTETVVDLTCSPSAIKTCDSNFKIMKQESIENDDTILPSPTSGPINFNSIYKLTAKSSPHKQKKSLSILKLKSKEGSTQNNDNKENKFIDKDIEATEFEKDVLKESNRQQNSPSKAKEPLLVSKLKSECTTFIDDNDENLLDDKSLNNQMGESVDILRHFPKRFPASPSKQTNSTPIKFQKKNADDIDDSISLLHQVNKPDDVIYCPDSPTKRPLSQEIPPSMSVLRTNLKAKETASHENIKRTKPDIIEPVFKEPTLRKKADKLALPGWSCEQCKEFYAELYKDDLEKLKEKMDICSRHRGRRDPSRPKTPPGFWNPRWHVTQDTDEFNRRNDAL